MCVSGSTATTWALGPWAIAQGRTLALDTASAPVIVRGNDHAIEDALRNLVENAVAHAPPNSEVVVQVDAAGRISVSDSGPGVPVAEREHVFKRFWRGAGASNGRGRLRPAVGRQATGD